MMLAMRTLGATTMRKKSNDVGEVDREDNGKGKECTYGEAQRQTKREKRTEKKV